MRNKKGVELAISTLVIIVIAVIVLVVIVVGFAVGWSNLWGNIAAFFGGSNVDTVVKACNTACLTESKDAWCNEQRTVTGFNAKQTCEQLKTQTAKGFKACDKITC